MPFYQDKYGISQIQGTSCFTQTARGSFILSQNPLQSLKQKFVMTYCEHRDGGVRTPEKEKKVFDDMLHYLHIANGKLLSTSTYDRHLH